MITLRRIRREHVLAAVFFFLVAALVVGQRFGFRWAGGEGYQTPREARVLQLQGSGTVDRDGTKRPLTVGGAVARGETVATNAGGYALLAFDGERIALDERTTATVDENDAGGVRVDLMQGRVLVDTRRTSDGPPITVKTGNATSSVARGALSVVFYDFLWQADVWPLRATMTVASPADGSLASSTALRVSTDGAAKATPSAADFDHGPSAAFYRWTQSFDPFR